MIALYVAGFFAERELTFVYYTEFSHVPAEDRVVLRSVWSSTSAGLWGTAGAAVRRMPWRA
ncbi:hypothetical protein [Nocardia sp. NPDC004750]